MSCCGVTIEAHRNADKRITYTPGRRYSFAGFTALMQVRDGADVLLSVSMDATANGSVFTIVDDSLVLTIEKQDILSLALSIDQRLLSYDIVISQAGFEDWFVGGDFVVLGLNDAACENNSTVTVELGGQCVDVTIEGGNIGAGASVLLADLNAAVAEAQQAAEDATVNGAIAGAAAGSTAGATAGEAAGTTAGSTAGTAAANVVVAGKADKVISVSGTNVNIENIAALSATPEVGGVVSGVLSDILAIANTVALRNLVNTGVLIDGQGRTYDIYGEFRPTLACRMRNITLRQRSTDSNIEKHFLLDGVSASEILLENVVIDCNGLTQVGGMSQARALQISNYSGRVVLRNLEVINGKNITAVELVGLSRPVVTGLKIREFYPSFATEPLDDVCQGLSLTTCTNALVLDFDIENMKATWTGAPALRRGYSRGIVAGTSTGALIANGRIRNVEQGIDLTGGAYGFTVDGNLIVDAGTWGIKNANRFNDISIQNNTIISAGSAGIVISAPGDATGVQPSRVTIRNNTIKDTGSSGLWAAGSDSLGPRGPAGIKVSGRTVASPGYPAGVRMFGNTIEDSQSVKTMVWGIDVIMSSTGDDQAFPALSNVPMVEEWDNTITGWSTGGRQRGCQYHRCGLTGTGTLSFANNTWVAIPFTLSPDRDDTAAMHDPTVNPSFITVRESGFYAIRAFLPWDNVAVGVRGLRFRVAGGNSFSQVRVPTGYGSTGSAELEIFGLVRIQAGQRVELEGFQDSGNAVVQSLVGCTFDLALVHRGL